MEKRLLALILDISFFGVATIEEHHLLAQTLYFLVFWRVIFDAISEKINL